MYRLVVLTAASILVVVAIRSWPARTIAPPPVVTIVEPPAIVVAPPPPAIVVTPPPPPAMASFLATPPPREPSERTIALERAKQCTHPDPRRTKDAVLALAAVATGGACTPAPYESGSSSIYVCGDEAALDTYTVVACGRCLTYRWYEGTGWNLDAVEPTDPDTHETC